MTSMNHFFPGICQSLSTFSFNTASTFLANATKNSVFSPYSIFLALFLTSAIDPDVSPRILRTLQFPNTEISPSNQIRQLFYFTRRVETLPAYFKPISSSAFNNFISEYKLDDDHIKLVYRNMKKILNQIGYSSNKTTDSENYFLQKIKNIESISNKTLLYLKARNFKKNIEGDIYKKPLITISNYLFINSNSSFAVPSTVSRLLKHLIYHSEFPVPACQEINQLIKNNTRGLIDNFVSESDLPPTSMYFVANALYFKAQWLHPFESSPSTIFTSISGKEKQTKFMQITADFDYYESEDLIYVSLPFCKSSYAFEIIMPKDTKQFNQIGEKLYNAQDSLLNVTEQNSEETKLFLKMPKFTIQTELMNFDNIINIQGINSVLQKVVFIVDEKEIAAAAATGVVSRSVVIDSSKEVLINKPFHFTIRNKKNHIPLYIGTFVDPIDEE